MAEPQPPERNQETSCPVESQGDSSNLVPTKAVTLRRSLDSPGLSIRGSQVLQGQVSWPQRLYLGDRVTGAQKQTKALTGGAGAPATCPRLQHSEGTGFPSPCPGLAQSASSAHSRLRREAGRRGQGQSQGSGWSLTHI